MSYFSHYKQLIGIVLALILLGGCADGNRAENDFLIRVNGLTVTGEAFADALEIAKAAYPFDTLRDEATIKAIKTRLLKQMTEELVLARRAEELDLTITDVELDEAVALIREDYPEGRFEATLLENAIPLQAWKERLRMRLLMEKLIERELVAHISITPDEISRYYDRNDPDSEIWRSKAEVIDSALVKQLRRKKAQDGYPEWIESIQQQYPVELNAEKWKEILG